MIFDNKLVLIKSKKMNDIKRVEVIKRGKTWGKTKNLMSIT